MNDGPAPAVGHDARDLPQRARRRLRLALKAMRQRLQPSPLRQCVFVAGVQRSGTNLLMDLLDATPATQVFHETDPRAFANYEMRERAVIRALAKRCPASVMVVKSLCELDLLPQLMDDFAPAKTLWMVRDWRGSAASAVRSFGRFVPQWQRLAKDENRGDWRSRGMSATTRDVLRSQLRDDATEIDGAAVMWYYRNVLFFEHGFDRDPRVRLVFYEDLLRDPEAQMRSLFAFMELPTDGVAVAVRDVRSGSARGKPQAPVSSSVATLCDALLDRFHAARAAGVP